MMNNILPSQKITQELRSQFPNLNDRQLEAVAATEGPLLILAGAGSGKTTVLISRITHLLQMGVEPWRIIAITFTKKAAGELRERLERAVGEETAESVWAQTFHSACVRILRKEAGALGFSQHFTIYDSSDSQSLMKQVIRDLDVDDKKFPPREVLSIISSAKDKMLSPEDMLNEATQKGDLMQKIIARAYAEYQNRMAAADAMDFDDLILNTVLLLQNNEDVRNYYQKKFRYVLVDEYQDTNRLQYRLTALLAGGYKNICVVGDDDQSIYRFRGATIENILSFENQYSGARVIRLEQNYRSTGYILKAANAVIANNHGRKGKTLWTSESDGECPILHLCGNESEEAQYVADRILDDVREGIKFSEHVILYRMNAQSNQFEYAFTRLGIPFRIIGGMRFYDRAEIKDMLSYLAVINNTEDSLRLIRIVNMPPRGIGATSLERAQEISERQGLSLYSVLQNADKYPELKRAAASMIRFTELIEDLREYSGNSAPDKLYDYVLHKTGYLEMLALKDCQENRTKAENIKELKTSILGYIKEAKKQGSTPTIQGFLDDVALYSTGDDLDENEDRVALMTIHGAKGLEFESVFLVGAEEGIFPGIRSIGDASEMEEERRLCYVAITRAKKNLTITCAEQRMLFGHTSFNRVSRFIEEIPDEYLEHEEFGYGLNRRRTSQGMNGVMPSSSNRGLKPTKPLTPIPTKKPAELPSFSVGDTVRHRSFGVGTIAAITPMGNDALVQITFEEAGTKRLMLRAAAKMLTKENS